MAQSPPKYEADKDFFPLFQEEGCPFLVHHLSKEVIAATKYSEKNRPNIKSPERRLKLAARDDAVVMGWLLDHKYIFKSVAWLSGAVLVPTKLFPKPDAETDCSQLPTTLYEDLVEAWRRHPGHAEIEVYINKNYVDFVTKRHEAACPRSEPLAAEQCITSVRISQLADFPIGTWAWHSTTIDVPGEACDRTRHVALAQYKHDGREGMCCSPMVAYWHAADSAARDADGRAVMAYLNERYNECRQERHTFSVYAPGAIRQVQGKKRRNK